MKAFEDNVVVLGFDEGYAPAGLTTLFSIYVNSSNRNFETVVLMDKLSKETMGKIDHLARTFARKITLKRVSSEQIDRTFPVSGHISSAAYFRLFAPELIDCKNLLWIDSDTIVHCDVSEIFNFNDGEKIAYGVNDRFAQKSCNARLAQPADEPYLNSGVLLIDREKWLEFSTLDKCVSFASNKDAIKYWDQCIINKVLCGNKGSIPVRFNIMQHEFDYGRYAGAKIAIDHFRGIIHYTTQAKPWHAWCSRGLIEFYNHYSKIAPFKMKKIFVPEDDLTRNRLGELLSQQGW